MAIDYAKLAATAQRLITDAGRTITLVRPTESPADPTQPWNGPSGGETTLDVPGVQLLPNSVRIFGLSALGDANEFRGLVTYSELVYVVFPGENDLSQFTFVRDNGIDFQIEATQELKPKDVTLVGYIGVRR
ncbi:MAG: hypothetical protein Unbinned200contig1000_15 [Prokaryotic dsDNA virus sp.]|jgi:hypothetical protein|nr:hypothetical protein [Flavobacteriaceae bacterium]QDP65275.1 MAG: hypothetical protein Unbinned200contig1000_15 [Prokaryotic dsDNA virus sp.]|tara:strand:+ start:23093 stop:23488 length:396 start_codon:yes stop_codon:yes gene_type:complete